jgi:glycosyltransferase involved in cell wall biosynthesis
LKETDEEPLRESINGTEVTRIPLRHCRGGKFSYAFQYSSFILIAGLILTGRAWRRRYDLVHVHNMPDVLVFSALVPKILGAKVILDLHDPMPELMMTIFGLQEDSWSVWLLKVLEKWSLRFADAALTVNKACKNIFSARSCRPEKIGVIMNSPDEGIFQYREALRQGLAGRDPLKPFVIMYHGSLVERHGLDLAVGALEKIRDTVPRAELRVYGRRTPFLERVMDSTRRSQVGDNVRYMGPKNLEEIAEAIRQCDVGVIPNRRSIFTELNTPTRIFEYLSQGKPVVAPRARGILDYFGPQELTLFELGNPDDLAAKLEYVFRNPEEIVGVVNRGQEVYRAHQWAAERSRFLELTRRLVSRPLHSEAQVDERRAPDRGFRR